MYITAEKVNSKDNNQIELKLQNSLFLSVSQLKTRSACPLVQLICAFVFRNANVFLIHDTIHMIPQIYGKLFIMSMLFFIQFKPKTKENEIMVMIKEKMIYCYQLSDYPTHMLEIHYLKAPIASYMYTDMQQFSSVLI